jgi:hypothetical protein
MTDPTPITVTVIINGEQYVRRIPDATHWRRDGDGNFYVYREEDDGSDTTLMEVAEGHVVEAMRENNVDTLTT